MTIRNLTAAIMLGLGTVSSPILIGQAQAADMETQAIAEQVKASIDKWNKINSKVYQRFIAAQNPSIDAISVTTDEYQTTDTGAIATDKVTITLNPDLIEEGQPSEIVLTLKNNILYNDELMTQDILARINSEFVITDELKALFELDDKDAAKLNKALEYLDITTDLHPDGRVNQNIQIRPFEFEEDSDKIKFDGLTLLSNYNESTAIDGVGEVQLEFGQLTLTGQDEAGQEDVITVAPFNIEYALEEDGDLKLTSTPFKLEYSEDNVRFTIEGIKGEGDDIHFNEEIGVFTGEQEFVLENIQFSDDTMPVPLKIDSIRYINHNKKDGEFYDASGEFNIDVNGESIRKVTEMEGLEIENISFKVELDDVSALTIKTANYQLSSVVEQGDEDKIQATLQTIISDLASNQSSITTNIAFNTDQGDATFVANIKAKSDAVTDSAQWQAAFNAEQPTAFIGLIQESFDFDVKLTIPDSLLKATGLEGMMAMGAGYIVKDGSDYTLHLESSDDGIKLNGNVLPFAQ